MSDQSAFRTWLKRRRQERGLTQEELGEQVGYAGQTIRKIESGRRRPSLQLAMRLAQVLQIAPEEQATWMAMATASTSSEPEAATPLQEEEPPASIVNLPTYLTPFVGREQEQARLASLLNRADCRLVTLLGPGGVGKTRLAVETARTLTGFQDGVTFVALASVAAPMAIIQAIGDALGYTFAGTGELTAQLLGYLNDMNSLLILDNIEHLLDPANETLNLVGQLLSHAPHVALLVTSRERLKLAGEWVMEIGGLAVPQPQAKAMQIVSPALVLFAEHAQRVEQGFRVTPANEAAIATICRLVDGLPLGIELAAAWTRMLSLEEINQELARSLDTAHPSPGMLPPRHHSLRAVVDHSWRLLTDTERRVLCRLSIFQGGFTREAATRVAGANLGLLTNLADKSLLRRGAGGRYDLHEIIRQYAEMRLEEQPAELAAARDQHAAYYMHMAAEREQRLKGADQVAAVAEISAEIDNIRAAWQWASAHSWLNELERAAEVMQWFYEFRSWLQEGVALFAQAIERLRSTAASEHTAAHRQTLARLLGHYGYVAARFGLVAQAHTALAESYGLLAGGQDLIGLSRTLAHQGIVAHWKGNYSEARRLLDQSLSIAITTGDPWTRPLSETWASIVAYATGAYEEAEQLFRAGLAGWRATENPRALVWSITYCSSTLMALGKYQEAQQLLHESLALSYATKDRYGTAMTLHHLGLAAFQQHGLEEAIYFLREALPLLHTIGSWEYARALNDLGAALWQSAAKNEARRAYAQALTASLQLQALLDALQALTGIALLLVHDGKHREALRLAARVLADPASTTPVRRAAAEIQQVAQQHLPAEEAAMIEKRAAALALTTLQAEYGLKA